MNERIRELATEAEDYADGIVDKGGEFHETYTKKFAELIVRECFKAAMIESKGHMNPIDLMKRMKERVGVENQQGWVCPNCGTDRTKAACPKGHMAAVTGDCPMSGVAQ